MTVLQYLRIGVLACLGLHAMSAAWAADTPDGLAATRALVQAGALQLALQRMDVLQPGDAAASPKGTSFGAPPKGTSFGAPWAEWERLRLQVLARSNRHDEVLKRAAAFPVNLPADARVELQMLAAQSALALGQGAVARDYAARALWAPQRKPPWEAPGAGTPPQGDLLRSEQIREMRLLVIRSYARESHAGDAYGSMLRFQQDYRPLTAAVAAEFVDTLLDLDRVQEAVDWLGALENGGATQLRLRLRTGLVKPQEAVALARAALKRTAPAVTTDAHWWRVILDAAQRQPSAVLRLEALEQLLDAPAPQAVTAAQLRDAYYAFVRDSANTHHLLAGDDAGWFDFAYRRREAEPVLARAYFAYLARSAHAAPVRAGAQAQLAAGYAAARLPRAGLRLFAALLAEPELPVEAARHALGGFAEAAGDPARALDYWLGLPAPAGVTAEDWSLRLAALALRANRTGIADDIARRLGAEKSPMSGTRVQAWMVLAQQYADYGRHDGALLLLERVLPHAEPLPARAVLAGIGRVHETRNELLLAADFYLRSALRAPKEVPLGGAPKEVPLGGAATPDAAATEARLRAGLALARAGLRDDARVQFEWLLQYSKDPAQTAVARRELGR